MNRLSTADRARVLSCLVEGNSQRSTVRITGVAKKTVARLAVELGEACERIQCDEIWAFVGCKERQKKRAKGQHPGDVWTWVAIDPNQSSPLPDFKVGDVLERRDGRALATKIRVTEVTANDLKADVLEGDNTSEPLTVYRAGWFLYKKVPQ